MSLNKSETGMPVPIAAFMQLVDAYGSDPQRWPRERLKSAEALLHSHAADGQAARRYLAEAAALDRVLDAPAFVDSAQTQMLAERIATMARSTSQSAKIVAFETAGQRSAKPVSSSQSSGSSYARPSQVRFGRTAWAASAVLAASLFLGLSVAPNLSTVPGLHEFADAAGFATLADQLALASNEDGALSDEDGL